MNLTFEYFNEFQERVALIKLDTENLEGVKAIEFIENFILNKKFADKYKYLKVSGQDGD